MSPSLFGNKHAEHDGLTSGESSPYSPASYTERQALEMERQERERERAEGGGLSGGGRARAYSGQLSPHLPFAPSLLGPGGGVQEGFDGLPGVPGRTGPGFGRGQGGRWHGRSDSVSPDSASASSVEDGSPSSRVSLLSGVVGPSKKKDR